MVGRPLLGSSLRPSAANESRIWTLQKMYRFPCTRKEIPAAMPRSKRNTFFDTALVMPYLTCRCRRGTAFSLCLAPPKEERRRLLRTLFPSEKEEEGPRRAAGDVLGNFMQRMNSSARSLFLPSLRTFRTVKWKSWGPLAAALITTPAANDYTRALENFFAGIVASFSSPRTPTARTTVASGLGERGAAGGRSGSGGRSFLRGAAQRNPGSRRTNRPPPDSRRVRTADTRLRE